MIPILGLLLRNCVFVSQKRRGDKNLYQGHCSAHFAGPGKPQHRGVLCEALEYLYIIMRSICSHSLVAAFLFLSFISTHAAEPRPMRASTQLLVVTTSDWNSVQGTLQRYQRTSAAGKWQPVGSPVEVVVGKNGLGWGTGIVAVEQLKEPEATDPVKKEGDGRAPAGIFRLSGAFGYAAQKQSAWKMPYISLTPSVECVDDPASGFYNRVLDRASVKPDWNSSEHMLRNDELYRWGIIVDHNSAPPRAGDGSCIFLHIWRGAGQGTVGCTAMPREQLESVLAWLDPANKPLLVQLPLPQYRRLQSRLKLP